MATLFHPYGLFKSQFNACCERLLMAEQHGANETTYCPPTNTESVVPREPSEDLKRQVRERDNNACLCCGDSTRRILQVDHVHPFYLGGSNILDNLQTLCGRCNRQKGTLTINFRDPQTDLSSPPERCLELDLPRNGEIGSADAWVMFLCRTVNFFYHCGAVHTVLIAERGPNFRHWKVELNAGNDPRWLEPHLPRLLERIRASKSDGGYGAPTIIAVSTPDMGEVSWSVDNESAPSTDEPANGEILEMNVADARKLGLQTRIAELTGLSIGTIGQRLAEPHGRTLLRTLFEDTWPVSPDGLPTEDLAAMTVREARDPGVAEAIAEATGMSKATVRRRLEENHGRALVGNVFADRWPGNESVDDLGRMTAAEARDGGRSQRIAEITQLALADVERELSAAHGRTHVRNVFSSSWPGLADASTLGGMMVADARTQGLVDTIAELTGLSAQTVGRRLRKAHGRKLLRNAFEDSWPEDR